MEGNYLIGDGFDYTIIAVHYEKVVYSTKKCIEVLSKEDTFDHYYFNLS